jgi:hypothetical protein
MIHSEQGRYAGQTHPCYGVHPQDGSLGLGFMPWCFDGATVTWGSPCSTHSEALQQARQLAS